MEPLRKKDEVSGLTVYTINVKKNIFNVFLQKFKNMNYKYDAFHMGKLCLALFSIYTIITVT